MSELNVDYVVCEICRKHKKFITKEHTKLHGLSSVDEYKKIYPDAVIICESTRNKRKQMNKIKIDQPHDSTYAKCNFTVPSHRKHKRISYEEFKDFLAQGLSLVDMINNGCSKHQIHAFSLLAQGKFKITKQQFEQEYLDGKSMDEIAQKYGIQRDHLTQLREHFGIERKGHKFIRRKKIEKPLTSRQKHIIYGGLMGDARGNNSNITMKQSLKQKEYLVWKYEELKEHVSPHSCQITEDFDKRYNKTYKTIRFYTNANSWIEEIVNQFYKSGKKIITQTILDNLDELSVAVWFMDDGMTGWGYRSREKKGWNTSPEATFCTDGFSLEEDELMQKWFLEKWNLNCIIKQYRPNQYRLKFRMENFTKLINLIKPFIVPSMMYKVDYNAYLLYRKKREELKRLNIDYLNDENIGVNFKNLNHP